MVDVNVTDNMFEIMDFRKTLSLRHKVVFESLVSKLDVRLTLTKKRTSKFLFFLGTLLTKQSLLILLDSFIGLTV